MAEDEKNHIAKISEELNRQFPDLKPKIAKMGEKSFIYELEKHDNYTYFSVEYEFIPSGELKIDWGNVE